MIDINELRPAVEAAGLNAISVQEVLELLDRLEAAEADALEQARLNGMGSEREAALMAKLEAAEKSDAESIAMYRKARDERDELRVENETLAANLRGKHSTAGATYAHLIAERDALRAKVSDSAINVEYLGNLKKSYEEFIGKLQDERNDLQTELKEVRYRTAVAHDTIKALRAKIEAMEQPASITPEGWKLVPIEPTHEMKTAAIGVEVYQDSPPSTDCLTWEEAGAIYAAMLAAAAAPEAKP